MSGVVERRLKKVAKASKNAWSGIGHDNHGGRTAVYVVMARQTALMVIDGGAYGYMESPEWSVSCKLTGKALKSFKSFREARAWALSDAGLCLWMDVAWSKR
tara:strand:- start:238 stop:543 length:306 start_codon:yes stop_codon:yes gene_type:complete